LSKEDIKRLTVSLIRYLRQNEPEEANMRRNGHFEMMENEI